MSCGSCGGAVTGIPMTSAEVAQADRFVVTTADGTRHTFTHYRDADEYRATHGGHLSAVPRH